MTERNEEAAKHPYPSNYQPGTHWAVDEAWDILDRLPVGLLLDIYRFWLAGMIAGTIIKHAKRPPGGSMT